MHRSLKQLDGVPKNRERHLINKVIHLKTFNIKIKSIKMTVTCNTHFNIILLIKIQADLDKLGVTSYHLVDSTRILEWNGMGDPV